MKPTPARPKPKNARVAGSGTAAAAVMMRRSSEAANVSSLNVIVLPDQVKPSIFVAKSKPWV
jgi:hypothetical protein